MSTTLEILKEIKQKIKSKMIYNILFSCFIAAFVYFITKQTDEKFNTYSKIFPLSINKSGGGSPLDAIKSQFGISDKTDFDKIYNITELVKSKRITHKVASSSCNNKKYKNLAQWIIDDENKHKPFYSKKIKLKDSISTIYSAASIINKNSKVISDKTDFTKIETTAYSDTLSKEINETILAELSNLYISLTTEKPRNDLNKIGFLRDSLKVELNAVERAIAGFKDANQYSAKYIDNIPQSKLMRTREEIEKIYETTATAYQNARFKLLSESPIFQVLDKPGPPYDSYKPSSIKNGIIAALLSFILLSFYFCRKIFFKFIINELSKN